MASDQRPGRSTAGEGTKGKLTQLLGWITGDRRVEAKGKVERDLEVDHLEPEAGETVTEAERHVRRAHQELPSE
jgi:uncharacterized protein YjbJ (UPF0337 family)